ncbi:lipoprotein NlpC [Vibrio inusitatus NBRC 102082]|uniref:Lipoprotein NlpC n=1 Tax=Vibrio inusitatus NBRC 102082 TaxID=1219070 RepID=A0A4Y3HUY6_9VIBR|nr:NlpC/P60 family protein [Vibrio inusitatus]GEA50896.1 lipoprotein NlpC [Vibrio inusitatus NBRC 102082]
MKHLDRTKILVFTLTSLLTACASGPETNSQAQVSTTQIDQKIDEKVSAAKSDELFRFYNAWHQTPYRFGGTTQNGIDCSAFTQTAYSQLFNQSLPRTTQLQSQVGIEVDYKDRRFGDLVFFKTGFNTRHVGIYVEDNSFMHASTSRGVIISRLDSPYWADAFWQIRRVN